MTRLGRVTGFVRKPPCFEVAQGLNPGLVSTSKRCCVRRLDFPAQKTWTCFNVKEVLGQALGLPGGFVIAPNIKKDENESDRGKSRFGSCSWAEPPTSCRICRGLETSLRKCSLLKANPDKSMGNALSAMPPKPKSSARDHGASELDICLDICNQDLPAACTAAPKLVGIACPTGRRFCAIDLCPWRYCRCKRWCVATWIGIRICGHDSRGFCAMCFRLKVMLMLSEAMHGRTWWGLAYDYKNIQRKTLQERHENR